jgi:hypothetical protein
VAPPERTALSETASVLPPVPTVFSSRTRVDREPARDVGEDESDADDDGNEAEGKGKGRCEDYLDDDGDEDEGKSGEDEVTDEEEVPPVMRFGPPKGVARTEGDFFLLTVIIINN